MEERAPPTLPSGWSYIACFGEPFSGRMLATKVAETSTMTQGDCINRCVAAGYTYAGMQYAKECWCGNTLSGATALSDSSCSAKCAGYVNTVFGPSSSIPSFTYQGCYVDQSARALSGPTSSSDGMTRKLCQLTCGYQGYSFAGVEAGNECYCGNGLTASSASGCTTACKGDSSTSCGGNWRLDMMKKGAAQSTATTTTTTTTRTTMTTTTTRSSATTTTTLTPTTTTTTTTSVSTTTTTSSSSSPTTTRTSTTTTTSSSSASSTPTWTALGCYTDQSSPRTLSDSSYTSATSMTYASCQAYCLGKGYIYAGVEYGQECWCGSTINSPGAKTTASGACATPCSGDTSSICGGGWTLIVFKYSASSSSCSSSTTTRTSSSTTTTSTTTATTTATASSISSTTTTLTPTTTTTTTTSSASSTPTWTALGCYTDQSSPRTLSGTSYTSTTSMTYASCQAYCLGKGYIYAGVEYGQECWCGSTINSPGAKTTVSGACATPCSGDTSSICGGGWVLTVFKYSASSGSSSSSTTTTTTTTTTATTTTMTTTTSASSSTSSTCTTTSAGAAPSASGYAKVGCFRDSYNRVLPVSASAPDTTGRTVSSCFSQCFALGYAYAGLETGSECWCGDSIHVSSDPGTKIDETSGCGMKCTGDAGSTCGGSWGLMVYYNQGLDSGSCATASTSTATSTTSTGTTTVSGTPMTTGNEWVSYNQPKDGKSVVAHFMVENTWSYDSAMWTTQMTLAQAQGIDAFALNFGSPSWEYDRMQNAYDAAAAVGFKVFLSFDMTSVSCSSWADTTSISSTIVRWANHAAQLKDSSGAVYLSTFAGEYCYFGQGDFVAGWLQAVKTGPKAFGVTTKFISSFFSDPSNNYKYTSFMDGTFPWNTGWPMGNDDETWSPDTTHLNSLDRSRGQVYMAPVAPWFFTHYGSDTYNKNWIYRGDDWLYNVRWEDIISHRSVVDLVEIVTWNNYGESHYIGPIGTDQPMSNAWVDGFDHTAWLTMSGYYIQMYKTGVAPTITQDKIYMWARPHGKSDSANDYIGRPNNADWTNDYVWIVLFATGPGTLTVTQGSSSGTFGVYAGVNKLQLASAVASSVTATLTRTSAQVFSYTAPISFTHTPATYNFNAYVFNGP
ncbi:hypothetical protein FRB90_011102 [Tulasnella sp. 427]|nr:hypothetical protein FRB90_011102 [Tulasnella sp. 427]